MLLVNKIFRSLFLSAVKFCNLIPPFSFGFRLLQFVFTLSFDDQLSLLGRCVKCEVTGSSLGNTLWQKCKVAIIYDHIVKIKQEVGAELYGEDANITGEARLEGRERIRYTRGQLLQLKGDILKLKQEVEAELFGEHPNQDHADTDSEASCFGSRDRVSYTRDQLLQLREVVNISDHILKIKQDVESELFGEDASRGHAETDIGGSRVEGCKSFRYTLDQMLQLREVAKISEDVLRIKEVAPLLFREDANVPAQSQARCFQLQFPTTQQQYTLWDLDQGEAFIPTLIKPKRKRARRRNRSDKYHVLKTAKEVDDILIIKQEVESELFVEGRGRADANVQVQPQTRCSETDAQQNREYNGDEQLSSQFATTLISPNQGGGSAEMPCSAAQKSNFSDKDHVLKTVRGILNQPTANKFDLLKSQLIASEITNADTLFGVVSLIFNKAVLEPTFCPMYAQLFSELCEKLPRFPSDEPGGGKITVKRILLNRCQEAFEGADKLRNEVRRMMAREQESEHKDIEKFIKLRNLGNIKLIGELFKLRMVAESIVRFIVQELLSCPEEENVEAICQFFITTGKQLDENENSRCINDVYFNRLKELSTSPQLVPRLRLEALALRVVKALDIL
ncbi:Eukaryotic translation initiation factor isoform 4G-1 [Capsicum annuum]|nr:Eukaryotic translation initiation factor isoform 4G-1 [Capsicum annuum]